MSPAMLRRAEAAALLGISLKTLDRLIERGDIRAKRVGGLRLIPKAEFLRRFNLGEIETVETARRYRMELAAAGADLGEAPGDGGLELAAYRAARGWTPAGREEPF
jgi:excisionase family DNA binding protein